MSISVRQQQIIDLLEANRFLRVDQLATMCYASPSSIRRDLTFLEKQQYVQRTHGGAAIVGAERVLNLNARMTTAIREKKHIAHKAAALLRDGQTVMLDSSSTAGFLVPFLAARKDITLFTNNLLTANAAINAGLRCFCLGGEAVNHTSVLGGSWAYTLAQSIRPDLFFFSSYGVDCHGDITDPTPEENGLRQLMLGQAKTTVFLCDSQKIGRQSTFRLANLNDVDYAVFDRGAEAIDATCTFL